MDGRHVYAIETRVPLGVRRGALLLEIHGERLRGALELFGQRSQILAGSYQNGLIRFAGELRTLLYSLSYQAAGTADEAKVAFDLITRKGRFPTVGRQKTQDGG